LRTNRPPRAIIQMWQLATIGISVVPTASNRSNDYNDLSLELAPVKLAERLPSPRRRIPFRLFRIGVPG
jgi:hypothetical protein